MSDRHLDFDGADAEYVKRLSDDWQVVEEALNHYGTWRMQKPRREHAKASVARLREREAQLEREYHEEGEIGTGQMLRAEAAEARVAELADLTAKLTLRCQRLEEALREIAYKDGTVTAKRMLARRALAHEEEKP